MLTLILSSAPWMGTPLSTLSRGPAGINLFFEPDEWPGEAFLARKRKTLVGIESDDEDDDSWTNVISRSNFETAC